MMISQHYCQSGNLFFLTRGSSTVLMEKMSSTALTGECKPSPDNRFKHWYLIFLSGPSRPTGTGQDRCGECQSPRQCPHPAPVTSGGQTRHWGWGWPPRWATHPLTSSHPTESTATNISSSSVWRLLLQPISLWSKEGKQSKDKYYAPHAPILC